VEAPAEVKYSDSAATSSKDAYTCPLNTEYAYGNWFIFKHLSVNT